MSLYVMPVIPGEVNYDFGTTIEGVGYIFVIKWNERDKAKDADGNLITDGAFYFSVYDVGGNPLATGIKIVLGTYLGRRYVSIPLFSDGVFTAFDTSGAGLDAGINDLGSRVLFLYIPNHDLMGMISAEAS
jgi:hypothetical protein